LTNEEQAARQASGAEEFDELHAQVSNTKELVRWFARYAGWASGVAFHECAGPPEGMSEEFVESALGSMIEEEALAVLDNHYITNTLIAKIAQSPRITAHYSVRRALVRHRLTPQGHAMKFAHHLQWKDLLSLSTDVRVSPAVRRSIEDHMKLKIPKLTVGEKIASAKFCSREIAKLFMGEEEPKVFGSILINSRVTEEHLLQHIESGSATSEQLRMIAEHPKWSSRYAIRRSLTRNPETPRAVAASILPHLRRPDLEELENNPRTSRYLRACIDRLGLLTG
ncbi:MAG: hypothetical protein R3338_03125, partial [Thermoanaerobaculia bacterium]|nr:hypothetical protein [Thermoanaerobaculia bacterium]